MYLSGAACNYKSLSISYVRSIGKLLGAAKRWGREAYSVFLMQSPATYIFLTLVFELMVQICVSEDANH